MRTALLTFTVILALLSDVFGQDTDIQNVELKGSFRFWDSVSNFELANDLMFIPTGDSGFKIVDVSDPASMEEVYNFSGDDIPDDFAVKDSVLFFSNDSSFYILDVTDPSIPIQLSRMDFNHTFTKMDIDQSIVCLTNSSYLTILDISNLENPDIIGTYEYSDEIANLEINGNYIFLASDLSNLDIIDISDPSDITHVVTIDSWAEKYKKITVTDDFLLMVQQDFFYDLLSVRDISDISNPQLILQLYHWDEDIYDEDIINDAQIIDGYLYYLERVDSGPTNLKIIDLATQQQIAQFSPGGSLENFILSGDYIYTTDRYDGIRIFDHSNIATFSEIGNYSRIGNCYNTTIVDHYAYVNGKGHLFVFDISDINNPIPVWHYSSYRDNAVFNFNVRDNCLCLYHKNELMFFDVSNPENPVLSDSLPQEFKVVSIHLTDQYVYVTSDVWWEEDSRITAYCIEDLNAIEEIAYLPLPPYLNKKMYFSNGYAYSTERRETLYIYNIADPQNMFLENSFKPVGFHNLIDIEEEFLYADGGTTGQIQVFNIENPAYPFLAYTLSGFDYIQSVANLTFYNGVCYFPEHGFQLYDISDPNNMNRIGYLNDYPNNSYHVALYGNSAILSRGNYLEIYDCTDAFNQVDIPENAERINIHPEIKKVFPNPLTKNDVNLILKMDIPVMGVFQL